MFSNLKNLNAGKIKLKVMAILLVVTLTFGNFALLRFLHGKNINIICSRN